MENKPTDKKLVWGIIAFIIAQTFAGVDQFYDAKTRIAVLESQQDGIVQTVAEIKDKLEKVYLILLEK